MSARLAAIRSVVAVLDRGEMLDAALPAAGAGLPARDRALAQEIAYGVLRWYHRFGHVVDLLLHRPMSPADLDVRIVLVAALHEIQHLRTPDHAAVSEAVESARQLGKPWAAGFVNALLRRFLREREALLALAMGDPVAAHSHPAWLIEQLRHDWPGQWQAILARNNERPPMDLRVNARHGTAAAYAAQLAAAGIASSPVAAAPLCLRLAQPVNVQDLPGFASGSVTVQDAAAQLAAPLLDAQPGHRVLDACAAPGGKASHLLEATPGIAELVVVDQGQARIALLADTLRRLSLHATLVDGDAACPASWWDGRPFDRILLDAPCSATGVIRRHPDIKVLRRPDQLASLEPLQAALLQGLWPLLAPGGRLLYVTCSLLRRENETQIEKFTAAHKDARILPIAAPWGVPANPGRQTLPATDDTDGFYYALLERH